MRIFAVVLALAGLAACSEPDAASAPASSAEPVVEATPEAPSFAELAAPPSSGGIGCASGETPVFACDLPNGKRVAVCGLGEHLGRYRYGGESPELQIDGGEYAYAMYSGGGESQIAFENEGHRYIVFSRMVRTNFTPGEPNDPAMSDGLMVLRGDDVVALNLCEGGNMLPVQVFAAQEIWGESDQLFTDETIRADPDWVEERQ